MPVKMLTLKELPLAGKCVFLRTDINTPVDPTTGALIERTRLEEAAATVRDLRKSRVVVASHQGRVGRPDYVGLSLHAKALGEILGRKVRFVEDVIGPTALGEIDDLPEGGVLVLDNLRFAAEENYEYLPRDAERTHLVSKIAAHVDSCVLDAFSTAHRSSPSIVGLAEKVPTCAGLTVERELSALAKISEAERRPYVTVLGGAKVSDRLQAIEAMAKNGRADKVLLCGMVGLVFLKAAGKLQGELGVDSEVAMVAGAKKLLSEAPGRFELPIDVAIDVDGVRKEVPTAKLPPGARALDIGSSTVERYEKVIKGAGTVVMSGPAGAFEREGFGVGTERLLKALASSGANTIVSGGHLSAALESYGIKGEMDHVSTAGGALVEYLAGKRLPLVDALERAAAKWGQARPSTGR